MPTESHSELRTSPSLLVRVRHDDPDAWAELVRRYGPMLYRWCRSWHLQEADAQDLTQEVLFKLARRLRVFEYDPSRSFRAYLKTLAHYAWCDLVETAQKPGAEGGGSDAHRLIGSVAAREDLVKRLDEEYDRELLDRAMGVIRERVETHTWEAFRLTAVEGMSGAEAAAQLGMTVVAVFKARSRVQQMLKDEVASADSG